MLDGFCIAGYRSFGTSLTKIGDLSRVNVLIGKNNSGKSNVLRSIALLAAFGAGKNPRKGAAKLDPLLDFCRHDPNRTIRCGLQVKRGGFGDAAYRQISEHFGADWDHCFPEWQDSLWFTYAINQAGDITPETHELATAIRGNCSPRTLDRLSSQLLGYTGGDPDAKCRDLVREIFHGTDIQLKVESVGAFRRMSDSSEFSLSGAGLIKRLRTLQSPELRDYECHKKTFAQINAFLRELLGEEAAHLEIPAERDEVYVKIGTKVLPLESLGTGIHELIIMAAAVTVAENSVVCIEEPEIHLHPALQKRFMRYIADNTTNQYLIASHSSAFFDLAGVNLYRCWLQEECTRCQLVSRAAEKHDALTDLGYRPSDILQANCIVWVEGPSDRLYLERWLSVRAPELVEGLHYAIMFYGGRLLAHLSYDCSNVTEFIRLSCLNRSACILMDSDRKAARQHLNPTKRRVQKEFEENDCLVWVTKGRTIENYLPENSMNEAIRAVHPWIGRALKWEQFADMTRLDGKRTIDKIAVARHVTKRDPDFSVLGLERQVDTLVEYIRRHNR